MATIAETLNQWTVTLGNTINAGQNLKSVINPSKSAPAPQMVQTAPQTIARTGEAAFDWKPLAIIGAIILALFVVRFSFRGAK